MNWFSLQNIFPGGGASEENMTTFFYFIITNVEMTEF